MAHGVRSQSVVDEKSLEPEIEKMKQTLAADYTFFKTMVDLVPASTYFDSETKGKIIKTKLQDYEKDDQTKDKKKAHNRPTNELSDKAKLKRAKFDPSLQQTVSTLQDKLSETNSSTIKPSSKKKHKNKVPVISDTSDAVKSSALTLEELRQKLQQKISALEARRKTLTPESKAERRQLKKKMMKLKSKTKNKMSKLNHVKGTPSHEDIPIPKTSSSSKPVFNKEGKMVFSKFDFSLAEKSQDKPVGKDFKKLLQKVERENDKFTKLTEKDTSIADVMAEQSTWKKVFQKAEGMKIRDNPDLLKKSLKHKEKRKEKSKKAWVDRAEKVQAKLQEKQSKRKKNIRARTQTKIDKKVNRAKKKGRIAVPGF